LKEQTKFATFSKILIHCLTSCLIDQILLGSSTQQSSFGNSDVANDYTCKQFTILILVLIIVTDTLYCNPYRARADETGAGERPNLENYSLCQGDYGSERDRQQGPLGDDSGTIIGDGQWKKGKFTVIRKAAVCLKVYIV
jgi:hypothetical protein